MTGSDALADPLIAPGERLCASAALTDGGDGVRFVVQYRGESAAAFAVRSGGRVFGYLNRCAHVSMEMDWQPGRFFDVSGLYLVCATHGALYSPQTGACVGGRCDRRGLIPLVLVERDGNVYLESEK